MPGELLRYLGPPTGFSWWWWLVAGLSAATAAGWYVGVVVWTLPPARLRRIPVIAGLHSRLLRRRCVGAIAATAGLHRTGQLSQQQAAAAMSRTLRSFLHLATGARAQYMHIEAITASTELATAAPVLAALSDAQFAGRPADIAQLAHNVTGVIQTWT